MSLKCANRTVLGVNRELLTRRSHNDSMQVANYKMGIGAGYSSRVACYILHFTFCTGFSAMGRHRVKSRKPRGPVAKGFVQCPRFVGSVTPIRLDEYLARIEVPCPK